MSIAKNKDELIYNILGNWIDEDILNFNNNDELLKLVVKKHERKYIDFGDCHVRCHFDVDLSDIDIITKGEFFASGNIKAKSIKAYGISAMSYKDSGRYFHDIQVEQDIEAEHFIQARNIEAGGNIKALNIQATENINAYDIKANHKISASGNISYNTVCHAGFIACKTITGKTEEARHCCTNGEILFWE